MSNQVESYGEILELGETNPVKTFFDAKVDFSPETSADYEVEKAENFVKGTSVLYDENGNVKLKWVKSENKKDYQYARQWIEALSEDLPVLPPIATSDSHLQKT